MSRVQTHLKSDSGPAVEVELESDGSVWIKIEGAYFRPDDWQENTRFVSDVLAMIERQGESDV